MLMVRLCSLCVCVCVCVCREREREGVVWPDTRWLIVDNVRHVDVTLFYSSFCAHVEGEDAILCTVVSQCRSIGRKRKK